MSFHKHHLTLATLVAAGLGANAPALAQSIGTTGAVNPAAQTQPPGGELRTMNVGGNVVFKQRVNTSANGSVQLIFVDKTTLNIGPNSQLVIDEFVYDPKTETGRMVATLSKGVMRFVGGQASHTGGATINTPATTLGVRGGVVTVKHDATNGTRAINHFGTITVKTSAGTEVIRRPGFALNVASNQAPPSSPVRAPKSEIDQNNQQLTSAGSQTGGRTQVPTDTGASKAGVGATNAPVAPTVVSGQQQNTAQAAQANQAPLDLTSPVQQQAQQVTQTGSQQTVQQTLVTPVPVVVLSPRRAYTLDGAVAANGLPPFVNSGLVAVGTVLTGKTVGYGVGGLADGIPNRTSRILSAGISIDGVGAAQTSAIYVATANLYPETATSIPGGGFVATARRSATTGSMGRASGGIQPTVDGLVFDADYSPTSVTYNQADIVNNARITGPGHDAFYYVGNGTNGTEYTYSGTAARVANDPGLGTNRPTTGLGGFMSGLMRTYANATSSGPSFIVNGDLSINLDGDSSRFGAEGRIFRNPNGNTTTLGNSDDFGTATLKIGYQGAGTADRSAYVDYDNFAARDAGVSVTGAVLSTTLKRNGQAVTVAGDNSLFVTSGAVPRGGAFPGVVFCGCEYTRWGFWSSETRRNGTTSIGANEPFVQDLLHMGTWVAGNKPTSVEVPITGSATYTGHVIGSFKTGNAEYLAAGSLSHTVNFGTSTGTVAINNLDGRNYALNSSLVNNANVGGGDRNYISAVGNSTSGATATMHMFGHFMKGASSPVAEMGGQFNVGGTNYIGSGTFAAKK